MTIPKFIEAAIEGGWDLNGLKGQMNYGWKFKKDVFGHERLEVWDDIGKVYWLDENQMFLDPKAWEAVGKVKGWEKEPLVESWTLKTINGSVTLLDQWENNMHHMLYKLSQGVSLQDFIATL